MPQAEHIARSATFMRQLGAGSKDRAKIFGETAQRLLKLS